MGCLGIGLAALLALAVPASIAGTSLVGAYLVIAVLAALAASATVARGRVRGLGKPSSAVSGARSPRAALVWIAALAAGYALLVTAIHQLR